MDHLPLTLALEASPVATLVVRCGPTLEPVVTYANASARALLPVTICAPGVALEPGSAKLVETALRTGEVSIDRRATLPCVPARWLRLRAVPMSSTHAALYLEDITADVLRQETDGAWVDVVDDLRVAAWVFTRLEGVALFDLPIATISAAARPLGGSESARPGRGTLGDALGGLLGADDVARLSSLLGADGEVPLQLRADQRTWSGTARARGGYLTICLRDGADHGALLETVKQNVLLLAAAQSDLFALGRAIEDDLRPRLGRARSREHRLEDALASGDIASALDATRGRQGALQAVGAILDDLQVYASINSATVTHDTVHLDEAVEDALAALEGPMAASGAVVERGGLPTIWGRADLWPIVFRHLLDNALRHARPGVTPHIRIRSERGEGVWRLSVADNGAGMPQRFLDRVFEPLFRIDAKADAGCGLGLAICRRVVQHHLGSVSARSTLGSGATIVIELPVRPDGRRVASLS